jgi:hypothetical protein
MSEGKLKAFAVRNSEIGIKLSFQSVVGYPINPNEGVT